MGVSKNNGTPKSSISIGFSIINHPFWGTKVMKPGTVRSCVRVSDSGADGEIAMKSGKWVPKWVPLAHCSFWSEGFKKLNKPDCNNNRYVLPFLVWHWTNRPDQSKDRVKQGGWLHFVDIGWRSKASGQEYHWQLEPQGALLIFKTAKTNHCYCFFDIEYIYIYYI